MGFSFGHLIGLRAKASQEEKENQVDEEKEDHPEDEEETKSSQASKKAEDDGEEPSAEDEEDSTSAAEGDSDEDEDEKPESKNARKAENKRCACIFASQYAAHNVGLAAHLAFETRMSASQAISTMKVAAKNTQPRSNLLDQRMQAVQPPKVGQDFAAKASNGASALATSMMNVYNNTVGKK